MEDKNTPIKFEHLMLDIETMSSHSYAAILCIAAIEFDITTGKTGKTFYQTISLQSSMDSGLLVDPDTIEWWMTQTDQSKSDVFKDTKPLRETLNKFSEFVIQGDYQIWGNSARFDLGILQNAYDKLFIKIPWDFRKERCLRTLVSFNPEIKETHTYVGIRHNALYDCYNQISYGSRIWMILNGLTIPEAITSPRIKCTCSCHHQNGITHVYACCDNGYIKTYI